MREGPSSFMASRRTAPAPPGAAERRRAANGTPALLKR